MRWADDVEEAEEAAWLAVEGGARSGTRGAGAADGAAEEDWLSGSACDRASDKLYPDLVRAERFLERLEEKPGGSGSDGGGGSRTKGGAPLSAAQRDEARGALACLERIEGAALPIRLNARRASARAQLLEHLSDRDTSAQASTHGTATAADSPSGPAPDGAIADAMVEAAYVEAVKLDPDNARCWNGAARALWKRGDLSSAQQCFLRSLEHVPDKETWANLSMLQRQVAGNLPSQEARHRKIEDALSSARAAVAMDVADAHGWHILGNAWLFLAFSSQGQNRDALIEKSLKAYAHSMKLSERPQSDQNGGDGSRSSDVDPDLRFNYGVVW